MTRTIASCCCLLAVTTCLAAEDDVWVITGHEVITEPMRLGTTIVLGGASLTVTGVPEPGLELDGNLWAVGTGQIVLEDSVVRVLSRYHGQYMIAVAESARLAVTGCDYRVPAGVHNAIIGVGNAEVWVADSTFGENQLISIGNAHFTARRLDGHFEVIVQDDSHFDLDDIPATPGGGNLWVWVEFDEDSEAVYTPPPPGPVDSWVFPPLEANGIGQSVTLTRCTALLWPMLVRPGARLTLADNPPDQWLVVGLHMPQDATLTNLMNQATYGDATLPFGSGSIRLVDTTVDTWNLYPQGTAHVRVFDSHIGELIAMEHSTVRMERTLVDGTGGYFATSGSSWVEAVDSVFTTTVEAIDDSTLMLRRSVVEPYPQDPDGIVSRLGAYDGARILADHAPIDERMILDLQGRGMIGIMALLDPPTRPPHPGEAIDLCGWLGLYGAEDAPVPGRWSVEAVDRLGRGTTVAQGTEVVEESCFGTWSGANPDHTYRLRLTLTDAWSRALTGSVVVPGDGARSRDPESRPGVVH